SCPGFSANPVEDWAIPVFEEFDHWEIFSEACHSFLYCLGELEEVLPSYDMTYSVHTPICDVNLAAVSDCIREASLNEVVRTAELASELEITMFTVHPGLFSLSVPGIEERSLEIARESMRYLDRASAEYGVTFAIENMPSLPFFIGRTAEQLASVIEGTDLSVCFDIGHANTTGQIDAMIDAFKDRIANVHIHDNDGGSDAHMTIGDGDIDFGHVLRRLSSYSGNYIIESKSFESAVESQDRLEPMLS
ncbi:MAG: sugar phosphate isomerase/epimerase, partial [Candidatus Methanomethylophilaceae archaeon]|nr:sugar phosphate isomerase/epimerase [Candidatus Methanomethylophilaceae archaeon]